MNTMSCEKHLGMGTVQNCAPCLQVELDYVRSEIEALRADVVWCVENPYRILDSSGMWDDMPGDAPDADILRAVREARTR